MHYFKYQSLLFFLMILFYIINLEATTILHPKLFIFLASGLKVGTLLFLTNYNANSRLN